MEYLSYEIYAGEIRPNPKKLEALTALPPPETLTQVRQFIGMSSYFKPFIPNFSIIAGPLYKLTVINKITWNSDLEER